MQFVSFLNKVDYFDYLSHFIKLRWLFYCYKRHAYVVAILG